MKELFQLGKLVATPGAIQAMTKAGDSPQELLARHFSGDWAGMAPDDQARNRHAVLDGSRIFSAYILKDGETRVWIITEAVNDEGIRASTCVLLPDEY